MPIGQWIREQCMTRLNKSKNTTVEARLDSTTANRLTAGLSIGLIILISAVIGLLSGHPLNDIFERSSTFFTDATGARGILLVMQRLLPSAEQWRRPFM